MKKIFIVLTHTGTILSKIIKNYTKDEFSHASISLDVNLEEMYSFGRLNAYNPFIGGFVHENTKKGTFKRFFNTRTKIYSLEVTEEQYEKVKTNIRRIQDQKNDYKFNVLGLFAAGFHKKIEKEHSFYCAEFVKYIIDESDIKAKLPKVVKPEDFKNMVGLKEIYDGLLRNYQLPKLDMSELLKNKLFLYAKQDII